MNPDTTRRAYLHGIASTGLTPLGTLLEDETPESSNTSSLSAADLVIPEARTPPGFEPCPMSDDSRFIAALQAEGVRTETADIAGTGYWKGGSPANPRWVLSSIAVVANEPLEEGTIEAAATASQDDFVKEYNAETSPLIEFNQSHDQAGHQSDWRVDLVRATPFDESQVSKHLYSDLMRLQHYGHVLLGTVAFAPYEESPGVTSLVDQFAELQRSKFNTSTSRV